MRVQIMIAVGALIVGSAECRAQSAPDMKGVWVEAGNSGQLVRRGGPFEHADPTGSEAVFGDPRTWTLRVSRQEGAVFAGTWESEVRSDPMVGVISSDGKSLYVADDNGPLIGTLRQGNQLELCRALADPTRQLAFCVTLARKP
jgi:hypothetical protein